MYVVERIQISMSNLRTWVTVISAISKVIRHMNVEPRPWTHKDLKVIAKTIKSMDIELLNVDPNPYGHQTNQQRKEAMDTFIIGITTQDKAIIIVKNMDISLRIALGHTSIVTTIDG